MFVVIIVTDGYRGDARNVTNVVSIGEVTTNVASVAPLVVIIVVVIEQDGFVAVFKVGAEGYSLMRLDAASGERSGVTALGGDDGSGAEGAA